MELFDYWHEYPPTHWLIRSYVGYQVPRKQEDDPREALRALPTSGRAKKISQAPERIRKMAESLKRATTSAASQ